MSAGTAPTETTLPRAPLAFAAGTVLLLVALPRGAPVGLLVAAEAGLGLVLVGSVVRTATPWTGVAAVLASAGLLAASIAVGWRAAGTLTSAATALVLATGIVAYGLHRYELLALGLVGGAER